MQTVEIEITIDTIKKGKPATLKLEAQIMAFENRMIFGLNAFRRDLNKNQRFKPHVGCLIKYSGQLYKATRIDDTDEPIHQLIYAVPLAA